MAVPKVEELVAATNAANPTDVVVAEPGLPTTDEKQPRAFAVVSLPNGAEGNAGQFGEDAPVVQPPSGAPRPAKPVWSDEEVRKLKSLYPTHSASAIANELGRSFNSVRAKAQQLELKRDGPPKVTSVSTQREAKSALKPKSLSAAAATEAVPSVTNGMGGAVPLLEHRPGQCRWLVSDVWPALYCGAPVVNKSSWCAHHIARVFTCRTVPVGGFRLKGFAR